MDATLANLMRLRRAVIIFSAPVKSNFALIAPIHCADRLLICQSIRRVDRSMLPALENTPRTPDQWRSWAFDHRDSHDRIRAAVLTQKSIVLIDHQVEPINPNDVASFLQNNTTLHNDMNSVLGQPGSDLQDVDFTDDRQLEAWIKLHYVEHYNAENALGI